MNSINEKAIEDLLVWAKEREDRHVFPEISKEETSYYINRESEETYIMEYSFKALAELRYGLEKNSGLATEPELLKKLTIEICQNRYLPKLRVNANQENFSGDSERNDERQDLPEYVYAF